MKNKSILAIISIIITFVLTFVFIQHSEENLINCDNLCWNNIEVGISNKETVVRILDEQNILYSFEGYDNDTIWMRNISLDFITQELGTIFVQGNLHFDENEVVTLISFDLDVCYSEILSIYGEPMFWIQDERRPMHWVYPERNLILGLDPTNLHIDGMFLHIDERMPLADELLPWSSYNDVYSTNCLINSEQ